MTEELYDDNKMLQQFNEISCQKAVSGTDFALGNQDYNFSIAKPSCFLPAKSYFRIGLRLNGATGVSTVRPIASEQMALADNVCNNLYSNVYFRGGGQDISSIVSFVPQAGALKTRITKSKAWLSSIGKSAYGMNADFSERSDLVSIGNNGPLDYKDQYEVGDGAAAPTVAIATTGVVTGINTEFTSAATGAVAIGDVLVLAGRRYTVTTAPAGASETAITVTPGPAFATGNQPDFAFYRSSAPIGEDANTVYVNWQPPIGIFSHEGCMGAGDYRISLNANADYKKACVESISALTTTTDFDLTVTDVKFYACTVQQSIPDKVDSMYLSEMLVQSKTADATGTYQYTVPPSTHALTVFVQGNIAGTNTTLPPSMFKTTDGSEKNLTQIQITYGNQSKPNTQWSSAFSTGVNQLQQRYADNLRETGQIFNEGGSEDFSSFLKRGLFTHYSFERDFQDRSTQVQLSATFSSLAASTKIFLVAHYRRAVSITTSNGMITEVRSLDQ